MRSVVKYCLFLVNLTCLHCSHLSSKESISASLDYFFDDLQAKDFSQMKQLTDPWTSKTQYPQAERQDNDSFVIADDMSEEDHDAYLSKALTLILSRPPRDNVVQRLFQHIRRKVKLDRLYPILMNITRKACIGIKNKKRSALERATYFYILENIITEIRPYINKHKPARAILHLIRTSRISIPDDVHRERYIRALEPQTSSPSKLAEELLEREQNWSP